MMHRQQAQVSPQYRLAESGLRVPACASLLSGMETSPSQGVEMPMLADQDFEDLFPADTWARLGRGILKEHDHVASLPSTIHRMPRPFSILTTYSIIIYNSMILLFPPGWIIQSFLHI